MQDVNKLDRTPEEDADRQQQMWDSAKDIHVQCEVLMTAIDAYIKLSAGDLSLVMADLKRLGNFNNEVILGYPVKYKLSEIMDKLEMDEKTLRKLFTGVGVDLDIEISNPDENVTYEDVVALFADRAGSKEGKALGEFLRGDSPEIVWG